MKTRLIFAYCSCVQHEKVSVNALIQKTFDGELVHFDLVCLYCDKVSQIVEDIDGCLELDRMEKDVMRYLLDEESFAILELALTGKTYTIPRHCPTESI